MTLSVQSSLRDQYRGMKTPRHIAFVVAWLLLFRVPLLTAQQDPTEPNGSLGQDETAVSNSDAYSGPAILSRGNQPAIVGAEVDTIQPFLNLTRIYGTGLTGGLSSSDPNALQSGIQVGFGLKGTHRWRRTTFQIEYQGDYRDYSVPAGANDAIGNGLNQMLVATAVSQLRRHLVLSIRQTGGILTQGTGGLLLQPAFLESSSTLPTNEPFSGGLKLIDSLVALTYQATQRLSFSGSIEGSFLRQDSVALVGTNSGILTADLGYRLSSRSTIGLDYGFSHFGYTSFGSADVNRAGIDYSWRAAKSVNLAFQIGMAHSNILSLAAVPIEPELGAVLGVTTGIQEVQHSINTPVMNARVTKQWRRASADLGYQRGISPGNGLVLASTQTALTAGFHYSHADRWTLSVQAGRTTMEQLAVAGSYAGNTYAASFSRLIRPGLQAVGRFSVLPVNYIGPLGFDRTYYRGEFGFIFSPSQIPVSLR